MADFQTAWNLTRYFEGAWTPYGHKLTDKYDAGNYFKFGDINKTKFVGTNFGFTAAFGYNYLQGWQGLTAYQMFLKMKDLSEDNVKDTFGQTKWSWCRAGDLNNQSIANLLFDFTVMADQAMIKAVATALGRKLAEVTTVRKITTRKTTDGYRVLNDTAVNLINTHRNPQLLFNLIKNQYAGYHRNSVPAIKKRVASFTFNNKQGLAASGLFL